MMEMDNALGTPDDINKYLQNRIVWSENYHFKEKAL
jgi:hypothetical protein